MPAGQVYVIRSTDGATSTLADPELTEFHGVPSIKGNSISPHAGSWVEGTTACVPLSHIVSVVIFDSRQQYLEMCRRFPDKAPPKA